MRGKVTNHAPRLCRKGITPAYAGKSTTCHSGCTPEQDHPRLCGEKLRSPLWSDTKIGSPPPMRGKVRYLVSVRGGVGITPAYAGKSLPCFTSFIQPQDHPRLCGEKPQDTFGQLTQLGSPPPMRGKANGNASFSDGYRITPAYAGKSKKLNFLIVQKKDHPRLCGEKASFALYKMPFGGSPPPMRGKAVRQGCTQ